MRLIPKRSLWLAAVATPFVSPIAQAQQSPPPGSSLAPVVVTADPLSRTDADLARPVSTLSGEALRASEGTNLGDTVSKLLGVQSSAYGAGAGRPIIRGMDSARVRITEAGLGVADVSGASPDHRVAADTLNARQVEVLRGPATLLYGSGAIGGLVNIVSERVPLRRKETFEADVALRGSTAERERSAAVDLEAPLTASSSWRVEGFKQATDDYELARPLVRGDGTAVTRLPSSSTDTRSVAAGASWFGTDGKTRIGAAVQRYESDYGIPDPDEPVTIVMRRTRYELQADTGTVGAFEAVRSRFAFTDYAHQEVAPDGTTGARFTNRGTEGRIELPYLAGPWRGVLGAQLQVMTTIGSGEGQLPETAVSSGALFVVQERRWGAQSQWHAELGARGEVQHNDVRASYDDGTRAPSRTFNLATLSVAGGWQFAQGWDATLTLTSAERAPASDELYFVGAHPATNAFQIGNPQLSAERSANVDLTLKYATGDWRAQASVFSNHVRNYIYGFFDGSTNDELSVLTYLQADASLRGAEAELAWAPKVGPQARVWADTVRGKLTAGPNDGGNLPRMSPSRVGVDLGYRQQVWHGQVSVTRVATQDRVSAFDLRNGETEQPTPGYTRVDVSLGARPWDWPATLTLQVRNLTNEDMRVHTSFLKDVAPLPGRSVVVGLRAAL